MVDPVVGFCVALCLATLLLASGVQKIRDFARFAALLAAYRIVPARLSYVVAIVVPCIEILLAAGLCLAPMRRLSLELVIALLLGYGIAMAVNLRRGRHELDCGCGTLRERQPIARWMLWRNGLLVAAAAVALAPSSSRPVQAVDIMTVACAVATAMLLYTAAGRLLATPAFKTHPMRSMR
jgi:hypothetical protein